MTCIVGVIENGKVFIGADSAGVSGWDIVTRKDAKVFQRGEFLIGYTSSFRMGQLLRYRLNVPVQPEEMDVFEYMVTLFVDAARQCLKDGGFASRQNETESGGTFLVGYRGRLFNIENDYQVGELTTPFNAVGCGKFYALAAMDAFWNSVADPVERIEKTLQVVERWSDGVRGPFVILSL